MSYERRFALAPWRRCVRVCASAREMLSVARGCHIFQKNLILFFQCVSYTALLPSLGGEGGGRGKTRAGRVCGPALAGRTT